MLCNLVVKGLEKTGIKRVFMSFFSIPEGNEGDAKRRYGIWAKSNLTDVQELQGVVVPSLFALLVATSLALRAGAEVLA